VSLPAPGTTACRRPFDAFWGARYAVVEDPNGIAVGLMSLIDPAKQYWPPDWPVSSTPPGTLRTKIG
jgi:hypothetical protein